MRHRDVRASPKSGELWSDLRLPPGLWILLVRYAPSDAVSTRAALRVLTALLPLFW